MVTVATTICKLCIDSYTLCIKIMTYLMSDNRTKTAEIGIIVCVHIKVRRVDLSTLTTYTPICLC